MIAMYILYIHEIAKIMLNLKIIKYEENYSKTIIHLPIQLDNFLGPRKHSLKIIPQQLKKSCQRYPAKENSEVIGNSASGYNMNNSILLNDSLI